MTSQKKIEFEFTKTSLRKRRTLDANSKTCSGCRICELICSLTHEKEINSAKSRISIRSNPFKGSHVPQICRHCSDVPCMQVCEVSAIQIREKDGTVFIEDQVCSGCRACEKECPFGAITIRFGPTEGIQVRSLWGISPMCQMVPNSLSGGYGVWRIGCQRLPHLAGWVDCSE